MCQPRPAAWHGTTCQAKPSCAHTSLVACRLRVVEADITACGAEALVSSSDFRMVHDAGVSKAICLAGGKAPHAEGQAADSHAPWGGGMGGSSDPDHTRQYRIAQEVQRELQAQGRSEWGVLCLDLQMHAACDIAT